MKFSVDRIEDGAVILEHEDLSHSQHSADEFDFKIKEGDVVEFSDGKFFLSEDNTSARKSKLLQLQQKLLKKSDNT